MILPDLVRMHAEIDPMRVAVISGRGQNKMTYREWDEQSNGVAAYLQARGIQKSDRVALFLDNTTISVLLCAYVGVHKIGAVNVPINTRLEGEELAYILDHCEAKIILSDEKGMKKIGNIQERLAEFQEVIQVDKSFSYQSLKSFRPDVRISVDDEADYLYTSGTTGVPKGTIHTHGSVLHLGICGASAFPVQAKDVFQTSIPFYTSSGCHTFLIPALYAGCTMIFDDVFDVEQTLQTIEAHQTTIYFGVPAMYHLMLNSGTFHPERLQSLRLLLYGGSVMQYDTISKLRRWLPDTKLVNLYGLTEAGPGGTMLDDEYATSKIGAVGKPIRPFTEIRIVDDHSDDVPLGEVGEIWIKTPSAMKGYFKDSELTAKTVHDGWIATGDLGRLDEDEILYLVDRKKDMVIRGGFNIYPAQIEAAISQHPAVFEVAVVGIPHAVLGQDLKAFIVTRSGHSITIDELREFLTGKLADYKIPRHLQCLSALPRNAMGKLLKRQLTEEGSKAQMAQVIQDKGAGE